MERVLQSGRHKCALNFFSGFGCVFIDYQKEWRLLSRQTALFKEKRKTPLPPHFFLRPTLKSCSPSTVRHDDVFLIVWSQACHTSLTTSLLPVGGRFLGSGTQQAPAQPSNSEVRSLGVLQMEICGMALRLLNWDVTGSHNKPPPPTPAHLGCPRASSASLCWFLTVLQQEPGSLEVPQPITRALCMHLANPQNACRQEVGLVKVRCCH